MASSFSYICIERPQELSVSTIKEAVSKEEMDAIVAAAAEAAGLDDVGDL